MNLAWWIKVKPGKEFCSCHEIREKYIIKKYRRCLKFLICDKSFKRQKRIQHYKSHWNMILTINLFNESSFLNSECIAYIPVLLSLSLFR